MHGFDDAPPAAPSVDDGRPWYTELNRYHWFVLVVAALGWLFDTMDQQLFNLARIPAMRELLAPGPGVAARQDDVNYYAGLSTCIFLMGWATGGLGFGILGDKIGRAKTMMWTILIYSAFTGLSALSVGFWDFAIFRFLTGLGVGGEFAVGVALVAEIMPPRARPFALGLLQALSAIGNISAAVISMVLFEMEHSGAIGNAWRIMFVIGTLPALLAILIRRRLKEPDTWQAASTDQLKAKLGSYGELFGDRRWRKNALVGMCLAFSGVVGLWGIGFFSIDLTRSVFNKKLEADAREKGEAERDRVFLAGLIRQPDAWAGMKPSELPAPKNLLALVPGNRDPEALFATALKLQEEKKPISADSVLAALDSATPPQTAAERERRVEYLATSERAAGVDLAAESKQIVTRSREISRQLGFWAGITSITLNIGAFFGIYAFTYVTHYVGRRVAFAVSYVAAMFSTMFVFWNLKEFGQLFWMIPLMGFCQLALFGGFAIYFPELFPTRLRSTGTSFCYNVGRFVAASGPYALGMLTSVVFKDYAEPMRYAGVTMCAVFLIGLIALPFAPETKGHPLPE